MSMYESLKTGLEQAISGEVRKVDMVEVIRCKDCKHFISFKGERAKVNTDKKGWCDINDDSVRSDDYCSYGERKEQ